MHLNWWWLDRRIYEYFAVNVGPLLGWHDPILIYQMGKVGSSSLRNSLFRCKSPGSRLVLMSHEFFPIRHRDVERLQFDPQYQSTVSAEIAQDEETYRRATTLGRIGRRFREKFYTGKIYENFIRPGTRAKVITLVREPIAANVSMFFQLLDRYAGMTAEQCRLGTDELIRIFLDRYLHARPLIWFDVEFKTMLGIDVYEHPFPTERGHTTISSGALDVLVLKLELDDDEKNRVLGEFLDVDGFQLVRSNTTTDKLHADAYGRFKDRIRVPEALLNQMYASKFARHFYSETDLLAFRERWGGEEAGRLSE
jgi:hypothetical protein